jgi:hypothetical protein
MIFNHAEGGNKLALFKYLLLNCLPCDLSGVVPMSSIGTKTEALAKQGSSVKSLAKRGHAAIGREPFYAIK